MLDYGRRGLVLDLESGRVTMELDRGSYHPETQPFPVAFTAIGDEAILVHATAWNRLDLSDPSCGRLRSGRGTDGRKDEPRPQHCRDYFHGRLLVSPGGRYLADDGWVWHPSGLPSVWNLDRWVRHNPFESEDGPSLLHLCQRDYYWDAPGRCPGSFPRITTSPAVNWSKSGVT